MKEKKTWLIKMNNKRKLLVSCDEAFYFKMKKDKTKREEKSGKILTWNNYFKILYGFSK